MAFSKEPSADDVAEYERQEVNRLRHEVYAITLDDGREVGYDFICEVGTPDDVAWARASYWTP